MKKSKGRDLFKEIIFFDKDISVETSLFIMVLNNISGSNIRMIKNTEYMKCNTILNEFVRNNSIKKVESDLYR